MKLLSKMNLLMMAFWAVFALGAVSCSDDDDKNDDGGNGGGNGGGGDEPGYVDLTPAEHKQNLEKTATKVLSLFNPDVQKVAIQNTFRFLDLIGYSDDEDVMAPVPTEPMVQIMAAACAVAQGETGALVSLAEEGVEEGIFDLKSLYGIYEYDAVSEEFVWTKEADRVEYRFPAVGSETNNAKIIGTAEPSETIVDDVVVPAIMNVVLSVDGKSEMIVDFTYETGANNQLALKVNVANNMLATLNMNFTMNQSIADASGTVKFLIGTGFAKSTGATTATEVMSAVFNMGVGLPNQTNDATLNSGDVKVTIQDIVLTSSSTDVKSLRQAIATYTQTTPEPTTNESRLAYMEGLSKIYNDNIDIKLTYNNKNNDKIADCVTHVVEDYSYTTSEGTKVIYYDLVPQLIFSDQSKIDFETYFGVGFESVIRKVYELGSKYKNMVD